MNSNQIPLDRLPLLTELLKNDPTENLTRSNLVIPEYELSAPAHFAGLVAVGGRFNGPTLIRAYENGIFPWPHGEQIDLWFSPIWRGVIDFSDFHISKSLKKAFKKAKYTYSINKAFPKVMELCSTVSRRGQEGTWIVEELRKGFAELHAKGFAHSLEAWDGENLVAGIYGVYANGNFSAESMFGLKTDTSKFCLIKLVNFLENNGLNFIDIQMITPVTKSFGGHYIPRQKFLRRLLALRANKPKPDFSPRVL